MLALRFPDPSIGPFAIKQGAPTMMMTKRLLAMGLFETPASNKCPSVFDSDNDDDSGDGDYSGQASSDLCFRHRSTTPSSSFSSDETIKQPISLLTIGLRGYREREGFISRPTEILEFISQRSRNKQADDKQATGNEQLKDNQKGPQGSEKLIGKLLEEETASPQQPAPVQAKISQSASTQPIHTHATEEERDYEADDLLITELLTGKPAPSKGRHPSKPTIFRKIKQALTSLGSISIKLPARLTLTHSSEQFALQTSTNPQNIYKSTPINIQNEVIPRSLPIPIPKPKTTTAINSTTTQLQGNHKPLNQDGIPLRKAWLNNLQQLQRAGPLCGERAANNNTGGGVKNNSDIKDKYKG
ncbi:hypothetical protein N0V88_002658 [Collariella sp. IMI 366227]|nr:hypothetical protein N0V88_002658 [Collariella sp. IMI 366227]